MTDFPLPSSRVSHLHPARGHAGFTLVALSPVMARKLRTPDFEIDLLDRCVRYPDGEEVRFTPRQWRLLELLVSEAPATVSRARLIVELFGANTADGDFDHLAVVIARVRRKLEPDPHFPRYLQRIDSESFVFNPNG